MLTDARSKALLGARPDGATAAHGGAQDMGLYAAPPLAPGGALITSPTDAASPTISYVAQASIGSTAPSLSDASNGWAASLTAPVMSFGGPATQSTAMSPNDGEAFAATSGVGASHQQSPVSDAAASPIAEHAIGSSGAAIPGAGLPSRGDETIASATTPLSPALPGPAAADVAPLVAAVEASAVNLQAALGALIGQINQPQTGSNIGSEVQEQLESLTNNVANLATDVAQIPNAAADPIGNLTETASDTVDTVLPVLDEAIAPATQALPAVVETVTDTADNVAVEAGQTIEAIISQAEPAVADVVDEVSEGVGAVANDAVGIAAPILTNVSDALTKTLGTAGSTTANVTDRVDEVASETVDAASDIVVPVLDDASDTIKETVDAAGSATASLTGGVDDVASDTVDAASDIVGPVLDDTSDTIAKTADAAGSATTSLNSSVNETVSQTIGAATAPVSAIADGAAGVRNPEASSDLLGDLAGADPLGGAATLTSLVSAADVLETHDEAPEASALFVLQDAGDTLDGLIAGDDPPEDAGGLLGVPQEDGGLLGGLTDHDDHGGLGLGLG